MFSVLRASSCFFCPLVWWGAGGFWDVLIVFSMTGVSLRASASMLSVVNCSSYNIFNAVLSIRMLCMVREDTQNERPKPTRQKMARSSPSNVLLVSKKK